MLVGTAMRVEAGLTASVVVEAGLMMVVVVNLRKSPSFCQIYEAGLWMLVQCRLEAGQTPKIDPQLGRGFCAALWGAFQKSMTRPRIGQDLDQARRADCLPAVPGSECVVPGGVKVGVLWRVLFA